MMRTGYIVFLCAVFNRFASLHSDIKEYTRQTEISRQQETTTSHGLYH
jgi:type VI protein secretion system component VasA